VLAGFSASTMHGARWVGAELPAYIIDTNRRPVRGIVTWGDAIDEGELCLIAGMCVTTAVRTAIDLACKFPEDVAVPAIDALARATKLKVADIESAAERHGGRKGIKQARATIALVDPGAESPRETWLRLLVVRAGYPRPKTQHPIYNEFGVLIGEVDMAWPDVRIALEYEGRDHLDPDQLRKDILRVEEMTRAGWIIIRVTCRDGEGGILKRLATAWASRM
jgi:very-short-patch-repair endonuclease